MARGGRKQDDHGERRCLIEGSGQPRHTLIRFVLSPDDVVTPDIAEKLGGRGVWVSSTRAHIDEAVKKKAFARGFKKPVNVPDDLGEMIEGLLANRLTSLLSIARKSGQIISGAAKVKELLQFEDNVILMQASDGSEREKRNIGPKDGVKARFEILTSSELAMVFGRETVIHTAVTGKGPAKGIANQIEYEANRLSGFRMVK